MSISAMDDISGDCMVLPMSSRDWLADYLTLGWVSEIALLMERTMSGRHEDSYLGEQ